MMPELFNEAFSVKATKQILENTIKNPITSYFRRINEVGSRFRGNRQADRQTDRRKNNYSSLTAHALPFNYIIRFIVDYSQITPQLPHNHRKVNYCWGYNYLPVLMNA
jgi:hypothetical protein